MINDDNNQLTLQITIPRYVLIFINDETGFVAKLVDKIKGKINKNSVMEHGYSQNENMFLIKIYTLIHSKNDIQEWNDQSDEIKIFLNKVSGQVSGN